MDYVVFAVAGFLGLQIAIGLWVSQFIRNESDYLVAGRNVGLAFASMSLFATWFGAETVIGSSAAIAEQGLAGGRADPFGYSLCLLGMGLFLAYQLRKRNYLTLGDFFRERYSRSAEIFGSLLFVPAVLTWAAAQLLALAQIIVVLTGVPLATALPLVSAFVIAYTWLAGLMGDIITDFIQGSLLIAGLIVMLIFVVSASGGPEAALGRIEPAQLSFVGENESLMARLDIWAIPILGSLVSQTALARVFATKSATVARRACFIAFGLYLTVGLIPVMIALTGTHLDLDLGARDEFLPTLAQEILPPWLFVFFMCALIAAILSTVDSTILTVSALVSHNVILPAVKAPSERFKIRMARTITLASGLIAFAIAALGDTVLGLVLLADSIGTAGLLVTVLIGLYLPKFGGPRAALAAFSVGLLSFPVNSLLLDLEAPYLFSIALALSAYVIAALTDGRNGTPQEVRP